MYIAYFHLQVQSWYNIVVRYAIQYNIDIILMPHTLATVATGRCLLCVYTYHHVYSILSLTGSIMVQYCCKICNPIQYRYNIIIIIVQTLDRYIQRMYILHEKWETPTLMTPTLPRESC